MDFPHGANTVDLRHGQVVFGTDPPRDERDEGRIDQPGVVKRSMPVQRVSEIVKGRIGDHASGPGILGGGEQAGHRTHGSAPKEGVNLPLFPGGKPGHPCLDILLLPPAEARLGRGALPVAAQVDRQRVPTLVVHQFHRPPHVGPCAAQTVDQDDGLALVARGRPPPSRELEAVRSERGDGLDLR